MVVYFNNCHGRNYNYAKRYGGIAFYDLYKNGRQENQVTTLSIGQECLVAAPAADGQIVFSLFTYLGEYPEQDESDEPVSVLFGKLIRSVTLFKTDAARDGSYYAFFDKNGHFKRQSVIRK